MDYSCYGRLCGRANLYDLFLEHFFKKQGDSFMRSTVLVALCFFITLSAGLTQQAYAQIERYHFDKAHTQILFFVDHLGFSKSQGEFHDYEGFFEFNRGEPEKSKVEVRIFTDSIDMDDAAWDDHMRNEDFFNVKKFPEMLFKSTYIEVTGDNTANIHGDMTILGVTKPIILSTVHNKSDKHPFSGKFVAGLSARTVIDREIFGMTYGLPFIGQNIDVQIEVEGIRKGGDVVNP